MMSRMGAKQGSKMQKMQKKSDINDIKAAHDQTVKCDMEDEDDNMHIEDDDDPASLVDEEKQYTNKRGNHSPKALMRIDHEQQNKIKAQP